MALQCAGCAGSLTFDPKSGKLLCRQCGTFTDVTHSGDKGLVDIDAIFDDNSVFETMDVQIYTCSTCGGMVSVNDVEITSVCPFCGNKGVIFDRIAKKRRPDAVIPFSLTKEDAEEKVRLHLMDSVFLSRSQKTMKFDHIVGIYVPYYIIHGESKRVLIFEHRQHKKNGPDEIDHISKSTRCMYDRLTLEASAALLDDASKRIEPFDLEGLKAFEEGYLQGFCSDMADDDPASLYKKARALCKEYEQEEMKRLKIAPRGYHTVDSQEKLKFRGRSVYALFPVWFVSGTYKKKKVTFLVNGQTGKVLGSMPFSKPKFGSALLALSVFTVPALTLVGMAGLFAIAVCVLHASYGFFYVGAGLVALLVAIMTFAGKRISRISDILSVSSSKRLVRFAGRRDLDDRT